MPLFSRNAVPELGHLEQSVMETLWTQGMGTVRDVAGWLGQPLAYNTVMTTLDRLFKKGLLNRDKQERAFLYSPRFSRLEWQQKEAEALVSELLAGPKGANELIVSCLLDAVGPQDAGFLAELETRIRQKRKELDRKGAF